MVPVEDKASLALQLGFFVSGTNPIFGTHHFYPMLAIDGEVGYAFTQSKNSVTLQQLPNSFGVGGAQITLEGFENKVYRARVTRPYPAGERPLVGEVPTQTIYVSVPGLSGAAGPAGGVLDDPHRPHRRRQAVEDMDLARRLAAEADDLPDRLQRRPAAGDPRHRAEHAQLGAIVAILGVEGVADEAAIAGPVRLPAAPGADLDLEHADRRRDERDAQRRAGVGDDQPGREIVAAVDDDVGAGEQPAGIAGGQPLAGSLKRTSGLSRSTASPATSTLGRPTSAVANRIWRWRLSSETLRRRSP